MIACSSDDADSGTIEATPTPSPEPTSIFASSFDGPRLNPVAETENADCSLDDEDGGCGVGAVAEVDSALPLPLITQTWSGIRIGIPEGFERIDFNNQLIIEAADIDEHPGNFTVSIRIDTPDEIDAILTTYADLNMTQQRDFDTAIGAIYTIPNANRGMIAVLTLSDEQQLLIQASVVAGYWPAYATTFDEMLTSLTTAE